MMMQSSCVCVCVCVYSLMTARGRMGERLQTDIHVRKKGKRQTESRDNGGVFIERAE